MDSISTNLFVLNSMGIFTAILFAVCLYFSLTYFEYLKDNDKRLMKQSKLFAVISLLLALAIPVFYQILINNQMFN